MTLDRDGDLYEQIKELVGHCEALTETKEALERRVKCLEDVQDELIYWLLRTYEAGHRQGFEDRPSVNETMDNVFHFLCNIERDPTLPAQETMIRDLRSPGRLWLAAAPNEE